MSNNEKMAEAFNAAAEGLLRASAAMVTIGNLLVDQVADPTGPSVTDPPVQPTNKKRIFGWNLGEQNYWQAGKLYNDALFNASVMIGQTGERPAKISAAGYLLDGDGSTRVVRDPRVHGAGRFAMNSASGSPSTLSISETDVPTDDNYFLVKLHGNCSGLMCLPEGQHFAVNPRLVNRMRGAGVLRFMDLRRTNYDWLAAGNGLVCYHDEMVVGRPGVRLIHKTITPEQAIDIARTCGATGIWWNTHFHESESAIREAAQRFAGWDGEIYFEHSNENWNAAIEGNWLNKVAKLFPGDWPSVWRELASQANWMGKIAKEANPRITTVMGSQSVNLGVTQGLLAAETPYIDCIAIAPYIGHVYRWPDTVNNLLAAVDSQLPTVYAEVRAQHDLVKKAGKRLLAYEAGCHIWASRKDVPLAERDTMMQAIRSDRMAQIYEEFMDFWTAEVNDVCCFFNDCSATSFAHCEFDTYEWQPRGKAVANRTAAQLSH